MTPEQLAHELDVANDHGYCRDAAIMIRQQQAEIEALKAEKDQAFKDGYSMGQYATLNIR